MASSGWQGNQDFPYNNTDLKCNLRIDSITHSGDSLRVTGAVGAVCPHGSSGYYAWYVYPVYVTPAGSGEMTLLAGNENVYGGGNNGLDSAKTVGFDVTIGGVAASSTSYNFGVYVRMNNNTASGTLTWTLNFDASSTPPSGASMSFVSSTWNSITVKGKVSDWGMGYSGTPSRHFAILNSSSSSGAWGGRKEKNVDGSSTSDSQVTISNSNYDTEYDGGINIRGCLAFKVGMWYGTSVGSGQVGDYTTRYTPPAPLQSITRKEAFGAVGKSNVTLTVTGGNSTNNNSVTVTTQFRYRTGTGSTWSAWSDWTDMGTGTPWTAKTATITVGYGQMVQVQARQVYQSQYSEVKEYSFTAIRVPLYGSLNGKSKPLKKLYGSVNGKTVAIKKLYGSKDGKAYLIFKDESDILS